MEPGGTRSPTNNPEADLGGRLDDLVDLLGVSGEDAGQRATGLPLAGAAQEKLTELMKELDGSVDGLTPGGRGGGDDSSAQSDQEPGDAGRDRGGKWNATSGAGPKKPKPTWGGVRKKVTEQILDRQAMRDFHSKLLEARRAAQVHGVDLTEANVRMRDQQAPPDDGSQFPAGIQRAKDDKKGRGQKSEDEQKESLEKMLDIKFTKVRVQRRVRDLDSVNPLTLKIEDIRNLDDKVVAVRQGER